MDEQEYSSLAAALADVPDPRQARGKRHPWSLILVLIGAALLSGQRNVRAIGQWVAERQEELVGLLHPPRGRLPSTPTLRRALRAVDIEALEHRIAASTSPASAPPPVGWIGQALDGKAVRGANTHGARVHLVSLVGLTPLCGHSNTGADGLKEGVQHGEDPPTVPSGVPGRGGRAGPDERQGHPGAGP